MSELERQPPKAEARGGRPASRPHPQPGRAARRGPTREKARQPTHGRLNTWCEQRRICANTAKGPAEKDATCEEGAAQERKTNAVRRKQENVTEKPTRRKAGKNHTQEECRAGERGE